VNSSLVNKILELKNKRNAVILAHNYQISEIQDIADFVGDSLSLSVQAAGTQADVIVFCGVYFMAETAAILSPNKTVLLPDKYAGCPMADMITAEQLAKLKDEHPDALVVCYVNSTAEVKALCDYCCTSSNAVKLVSNLPADREIIFVPDQHLGAFVPGTFRAENDSVAGFLSNPCPDDRRAGQRCTPCTSRRGCPCSSRVRSGSSCRRRPVAQHQPDDSVCRKIPGESIHHCNRRRDIAFSPEKVSA
jgi:hypothetical protein